MSALDFFAKELMSRIISMEWQMFRSVKNTGGPASCQKDYLTFMLMRLSQFKTWDLTSLASYFTDLTTAKNAHENLLTYKYAYMMQMTFPDEYAKLAPLLPSISLEKKLLVRKILHLQLAWLEAAVEENPSLRTKLRSIRQAEAPVGATSFEAYAKGELMSYSCATLKALLRHMENLAAQGQNQIAAMLTTSAQLYGYATLAEV